MTFFPFSFVNHIKGFEDVFVCPGNFVTLHPSLATPEDRTRAVGNVIKSLGELIPGTRNEVLVSVNCYRHFAKQIVFF